MLNTAVKAARKAGTIITRASFDVDKLTIRTKRQHDFVSEVDHAAEDAIISVLKDAYPDHGFLAEESGYKDKQAEFLWVIDPLDGTTNFLHGFPQYCVSIGLLHKGKPTQAVVFDPTRPEGQPRRSCDVTRMVEVLGWEPSVPLEEGLRRTVDWYRAS